MYLCVNDGIGARPCENMHERRTCSIAFSIVFPLYRFSVLLFFRLTKSRKIFYAQSESRGFHTASGVTAPHSIGPAMPERRVLLGNGRNKFCAPCRRACRALRRRRQLLFRSPLRPRPDLARRPLSCGCVRGCLPSVVPAMASLPRSL